MWDDKSVLITAARDHRSGVRSYFCKNLQTGKSISRNERFLQKVLEKEPGDKGDVIESRWVIRYVPPLSLTTAGARAGFKKKGPARIRFSSVTEVAWSQGDSHHVEESMFIKHFIE